MKKLFKRGKSSEENGILPRAYHTFYQFPAGTYYGAVGFDFSVNVSCPLKFMYVSKYTDGTTGTFRYVLQSKQTLIQPVYLEGTGTMNGSGYTVSFGTVPAGTYNLMIIPNGTSVKPFAWAGEVYNLNY